MAITRSLERRLARLEQRSGGGDILYVVDIGDDESIVYCDGRYMTLDEYYRHYAPGATVDMGATRDEAAA